MFIVLQLAGLIVRNPRKWFHQPWSLYTIGYLSGRLGTFISYEHFKVKIDIINGIDPFKFKLANIFSILSNNCLKIIIFTNRPRRQPCLNLVSANQRREFKEILHCHWLLPQVKKEFYNLWNTQINVKKMILLKS